MEFLKNLLETRWGDLIALFVLVMGVALSVIWPDTQASLGSSLVSAGLLGLGLIESAKRNNGQ